MSLLDVAPLCEYGTKDKPYRLSIAMDEIAYRLFRWIVLIVHTQIERHPIIIEIAAAPIVCSGEMILSEHRQKEGWRSVKNEAGYWYAYFDAGDANIPGRGSAI